MENKPISHDPPFCFLLVFGSRSLADHDPDECDGYKKYLKARLDDMHLNTERVAIISGGARGPDSWATEWASERGFFSLEYKPDYQTYGKGAPIKRDKEMADKCSWAIGFWDGESTGTAHTKKFLLELKKPLGFFTRMRGWLGYPYCTVEWFNWENDPSKLLAIR